MIGFLFCLAWANAYSLSAKLNVLVASTRYSRARSIPSLESLTESFEELLTTLDLPDEYITGIRLGWS